MPSEFQAKERRKKMKREWRTQSKKRHQLSWLSYPRWISRVTEAGFQVHIQLRMVPHMWCSWKNVHFLLSCLSVALVTSPHLCTGNICEVVLLVCQQHRVCLYLLRPSQLQWEIHLMRPPVVCVCVFLCWLKCYYLTLYKQHGTNDSVWWTSPKCRCFLSCSLLKRAWQGFYPLHDKKGA